MLSKDWIINHENLDYYKTAYFKNVCDDVKVDADWKRLLLKENLSDRMKSIITIILCGKQERSPIIA